MSPPLLYTLIILAYLPGLIALVVWQKCWRFPILFAAFVGMLVFNALGSISVLSDEKIYRLAFDSGEVREEFTLIIVYQALIFYIVAGTYIGLRKPVAVEPQASRIDILFCSIIALLILLIAGLYFLETGTFLLFSSLDGSMTIENALSFRDKYVYGLKHWPFYNVGFIFLPILLSSYGLILAKSHRRFRTLFSAAIIISFAASASLGSKAGVINFVLSLGIAYMAYLGMTGQSIFRVMRNPIFLCFIAASLALLIVGYIWATPETLDANSLLQRLWYRVFVAYPDTIAAAISYAREYGELRESMLPTIRGLLPHDQINLSLALHTYQAGSSGGVSVPMAGEAFIAAGWAGVVLILPLIYLTLIFLQELTFCLTQGLTSIAFAALYAYLAIGLSQNGMFSTLFNFMYPGTLIFLGLIALLLSWSLRKMHIASPRLHVAQHE